MLTNDKLKEECGVFGMLHSEQKDVSKYIYYGLSALQHRGQESATPKLICRTIAKTSAMRSSSSTLPFRV